MAPTRSLLLFFLLIFAVNASGTRESPSNRYAREIVVADQLRKAFLNLEYFVQRRDADLEALADYLHKNRYHSLSRQMLNKVGMGIGSLFLLPVGTVSLALALIPELPPSIQYTLPEARMNLALAGLGFTGVGSYLSFKHLLFTRRGKFHENWRSFAQKKLSQVGSSKKLSQQISTLIEAEKMARDMIYSAARRTELAPEARKYLVQFARAYQRFFDLLAREPQLFDRFVAARFIRSSCQLRLIGISKLAQ
jgi:hypothetical protein